MGGAAERSLGPGERLSRSHLPLVLTGDDEARRTMTEIN
jgi:hypothetical protein